MPAEKITNEEREKTLKTLNRIIQCRLALSELPTQLKKFTIGNGIFRLITSNNSNCKLNFYLIENGYVKFHVKNEFEVKLTLMSDNFKMPWRLLKVNFLVKDSQDPSMKYFTNLTHKSLYNLT